MYKATKGFALLTAKKLLEMKKGETFKGTDAEAQRLIALGLIREAKEPKKENNDD